MRKQRDARIVKFQQDYNPGGKKTPVYAKGSSHAIHTDLVAKLKERGAKFTEEKPDWNALHAKAKTEKTKAKAAQKALQDAA